MRVSRMSALTVAALLGAALAAGAPVASAATGGAAHQARPQLNQPYWEYATGYGATLDDAKADAEGILDSGCTYGTNGIETMVSKGQEADGSWWATMKAYCSYE